MRSTLIKKPQENPSSGAIKASRINQKPRAQKTRADDNKVYVALPYPKEIEWPLKVRLPAVVEEGEGEKNTVAPYISGFREHVFSIHRQSNRTGHLEPVKSTLWRQWGDERAVCYRLLLEWKPKDCYNIFNLKNTKSQMYQ